MGIKKVVHATMKAIIILPNVWLTNDIYAIHIFGWVTKIYIGATSSNSHYFMSTKNEQLQY